MAPGLGWLRQFQAPGSPSCGSLLILPHAGAGASAYRVLAKRLAAEFDVVIFQYPGRQDRAKEPVVETLPELAAGAFAAFRDSPHQRGLPLTVFGHSMGALVAFELVRLAESAGLPVRLLVASSSASPGRTEEQPSHPTEDDALIDRLLSLNGTDAEVMASREVMRMALPVLKADYAAVDRYRCAAGTTVAAPVLAVRGDADVFVTPADAQDWGAHTRGEFRLSEFGGGHFYIDDHIDGLVDLLMPRATASA
ncbi:thioesterase II family protein [Nocardia sp. alder85J]|uniref:thioesterase II family protein n=1 Tax=Nocardia sp. alder85J TaxID=2862949 RepID=UPI001CD70EAF|nr:alpha/beta fold hydrolase [Nocardia sp. alder85J]MCX4093135.1 alpha/beta fold hydrolase [Nocardia sp. alder85J]